jgi:hypothetical protein
VLLPAAAAVEKGIIFAVALDWAETDNETSKKRKEWKWKGVSAFEAIFVYWWLCVCVCWKKPAQPNLRKKREKTTNLKLIWLF